MAEYYTDPQRAAEESRQGKAISDRVQVSIGGHSALGQIVYSRGDYSLTYAGLKTVPIRNLDRRCITSCIDNVRRWRPL